MRSNCPPRNLAWVLAAALVAAALAGCGHGGAPPPAAEGAKEPEGVAQAKLTAATFRTLTETGEFLGVTEPEPNSVSAVSALVSARILQLPLREGDAVKAGQTVAVLDPGESPAQLAQARAQLEAAASDLRQADTGIAQEKSRVENDRRLAAAGVTTAQAQLARTQAELKALQAGNRSELSKAQAALATARQDLARVKAPSRPQELAVARAAVAEADAQRQNTAAQERRAQRLFDQQVVSRKQLEDAQAQARVAEAQYQGALERQRLAEAGTRPEEVAVAEAKVREAEAGVQAAQTGQLTEASKQQELAAGKAQIDQAEVALARAQAAHRDVTLRKQQRGKSAAQLQQARAALQQVQARDRFLTITAPVSGIVSRRAANQGDTAQPGGVLVEIAQPGRVRFRIGAPAARLAWLRAGQAAEIRFDSAAATPYAGRVSVLGSSADATGNGVVWLSVAGAGLRTGVSGTARITLRQSSGVAVPASALLEEESGTSVVVVGADHVAHHRKVKTGARDGDWVEVSGLRAGEQVATVGAYEIADGMKVEPAAVPQAKP